MKNSIYSRFITPLLGLALAWTASTVHGQTFAVNWHKIAGGGGISSNGTFEIKGTIGQPDAGPAMTGGNYSITGGFWAISALQTPGAPTLGITISSNTVMVYWPYPSTGWDLQVNTNLATTNWVTPPQTVNENGTNNYILVTPPTSNRYYRLMK